MDEVGERGRNTQHERKEGKKKKKAALSSLESRVSTHPGLVSRRIGTFVYTTRKAVADGIDRR